MKEIDKACIILEEISGKCMGVELFLRKGDICYILWKNRCEDLSRNIY